MSSTNTETRATNTDIVNEITKPGTAEPRFTHPGLEWLNEGACVDLPQSDFFVEAGRVLPERARSACMTCPVWEKCLTYAYLAGPDRAPDAAQREGSMINGGYFAGMSLGNRRKMTLGQAIEAGEQARRDYHEDLVLKAQAAEERAERDAA